MQKQQHPEQRNYNAIISLRLAILFTGTKVEPTHRLARKLACLIGTKDIDEDSLDDPRTADWKLYELYPELSCPIHALGCPSWLIHGADFLCDNLEMGKIDPTDWTTGLRETYAKLPTILTEQQESKDLLDWFVGVAEAAQSETLDQIRVAIKAKAEAIARGDVCVSDESEPDATITIRLR